MFPILSVPNGTALLMAVLPASRNRFSLKANPFNKKAVALRNGQALELSPRPATVGGLAVVPVVISQAPVSVQLKVRLTTTEKNNSPFFTGVELIRA